MAKSKKTKKNNSVKDLEYHELVEIVRGRTKNDKKNEAYNEIEVRIKSQICYIAKQFYIPGHSYEDILQEALYALRYKAIPDYIKDKNEEDIYPFDNFVKLCVRRHLSTLLKSSFLNKRKTLNTSLSLDQNRNKNYDDDLFLSDILPRTEGSLGGELGDKEYYKSLIKKLYDELSSMERTVFKLYAKHYSYEEISIIINKYYKNKNMNKNTDIKAIDNAITRLKQKGKKIFEKYRDEEI